MVTEGDEWGADPSVQRMRRVFAQMELAQKEILEQLQISPLDWRLRRAREAAKDLFEQVCVRAGKRGIYVGEKEAVGIYLHCLRGALDRSGFQVPENLLTGDERVKELVEEVSR